MFEREDLHFFVSSVATLATSFSLYKVVTAQFDIARNNKVIKSVNRATIKSPDDTFLKGELVTVKGTVAANTNDPSNQPIQRKNKENKLEDFILHLRYREPIYSNESFTDKTDYRLDFPQILKQSVVDSHSSFSLVGESARQLLVRQFDRIDYHKVLEITKWDIHNRKLNWTEKMQVLLLAYFRAATSPLTHRKRPILIRGIHIGTRDVECGIKVGSSIMALGMVGVSVDGQFFIEPQALFRDRLSFVASTGEIIEELRESRNMWLIAFLVGLIYVSRRAYKYNRKYDIVGKFRLWVSNLLGTNSAGTETVMSDVTS